MSEDRVCDSVNCICKASPPGGILRGRGGGCCRGMGVSGFKQRGGSGEGICDGRRGDRGGFGRIVLEGTIVRDLAGIIRYAGGHGSL